MTQICKPIAEQYRGGRDSLPSEYRQFVRGLAQRRRDLGLCQLDLDPVLGVAEGYIGKLEAFHRIPSTLRLLEWLEGLGLAITMRPGPLPPATLHAIEASQARRDEDMHK